MDTKIDGLSVQVKDLIQIHEAVVPPYFPVPPSTRPLSLSSSSIGGTVVSPQPLHPLISGHLPGQGYPRQGHPSGPGHPGSGQSGQGHPATLGHTSGLGYPGHGPLDHGLPGHGLSGHGLPLGYGQSQSSVAGGDNVPGLKRVCEAFRVPYDMVLQVVQSTGLSVHEAIKILSNSQ